MHTLFQGDIKADTFYLNRPALKESLKNDKDPKASEQMLEFVFQIMFESLKELEEEYGADGGYKEINTKTGKSKSGKYTFDSQKKALVKKMAGEEQPFDVSWKNTQLELTTEWMSENGIKGKARVVYQKQ